MRAGVVAVVLLGSFLLAPAAEAAARRRGVRAYAQMDDATFFRAVVAKRGFEKLPAAVLGSKTMKRRLEALLESELIKPAFFAVKEATIAAFHARHPKGIARRGGASADAGAGAQR